MTEWTRDMVEERVLEAADVLKQLPGLQSQGYFSAWPDVLRSSREIARQEPKPMKVLPSPQAISRMEEAITWNRYLEPDDAHLMWARADGLRWKGHMPPLRHQPADGAPALGLRAQRDRLAAERARGAPSARAAVRRRAGPRRQRPAILTKIAETGCPPAGISGSLGGGMRCWGPG